MGIALYHESLPIAPAARRERRSARAPRKPDLDEMGPGTRIQALSPRPALDLRPRRHARRLEAARALIGAVVVPAKAGTHIPEAGVCGTMVPTHVGDSRIALKGSRSRVNPRSVRGDDGQS